MQTHTKHYIYVFMLSIMHYACFSIPSSVTSVPNSVIDVIDNPVAYYGSPRGIGCTPDGTTAYIANYFGSNVSVVDIATNSVIKTIYSDTFAGPVGVGVTTDGTKAYILNDGGNSISIIDTATNEVTGTVDTTGGGFSNPFGIAIFNTTAYVANYSNNTVSIIDTQTDTTTGYITDIDTFNSPHEIAIFGTKAYITNYGGNTVSIVNTSTHTVTGVVDDEGFINQPFGIAFNAAGTYALVTNYASNTVSIIQSSNNTVLGDVTDTNSTFNNPQTIDITGTKAYVGNYTGNSISIIDITTPASAHVISASTNPSTDFFSTPYAGFITPSGAYLYMANIGSNNVTILNTSTYDFVGQVLNTGFNQPQAMTINQQGTIGYVVNYTGFINIVDIATNTVTGTVTDTQSTLNEPTDIVTIPQTTKAYVTNSGNNSVSIINTTTNVITGMVTDINDTFNIPMRIAVTSNGKTAYVTNYDGNTLSVIDTATDTVIGTVGNSSQLYNPLAIAITPNGQKAYVSNYGEGSILAIIDTNPSSESYNTVVGYVDQLFYYIASIAITLDSSTAYVADRDQNIIVIIDVATDTAIGTIQDSSVATTLNAPIDIALAHNSNIGYIANYNGNTISIFDTATNKITGTIVDNSLYGPNSIFITLNGQNGYITDYNGNAVSIIFIDSVIQSPATLKVEYLINNFIDYIARMNVITWQPSTTGMQAAKYNIYKNSLLSEPLATIQANKPLQYTDYNITPNRTYTYYIVAIDSNDNFSLPISKTITTQGK